MKSCSLSIRSLRTSALLLTTVLMLTGCSKSSTTDELKTSTGVSTPSVSEQVTAPSDETKSSAELPQANAAAPDTSSDSGTRSVSTRSDNDSPQETKQTTSRPGIADGYYAMGGTGQGLEVRGNQYRYYDEEGAYEWRPIRQLTAISTEHVFDGENYWCLSTNVPEGGGICTANGWQARSSVGKFSPDELSLGGIEAGASEAEVIEILGQPDQMEQTSPFSAKFTYRGLSVSFYEDAALTIRSVSPNYCTPSGVCPGMSVAEVERIYGAPLVSDREGSRYLEYNAIEVGCMLELELTGDEVSAIGIVCQI
jgi:hypothetical protein